MQIDDFIRIEQKYDLYHLEIEGVQPWMYFRFKFWNYGICKELLSLSNSLQTKSKIKIYGKQLKTVLNQFPYGGVRHICRADIIFYAHSRRIKRGRYFECIYTDCLLDKYPQSIVMEDPFMNQHLTPIRAEHVYYTDLLRIKAILYSRIIHRYLKTDRYQKIYKQIQNNFEKPLREIETAYQFAISYKKIYMELTEIVLEIQLLKKEMRKVLEKVRPRLIVEVVYYDTGHMVLNELAKEKGIPTVELQHGTMHAAHAAYQFADRCGEISQFPEYIFLFSEYWKNCAHLPIDDARVKVTGYPYFERQLSQYRKAAIERGNITNIIFVSQGTIGRELSRLAADLYDMLDERQYHIIYKLHPGEYEGWRERNAELIKENIEVIDSLEHNIYEYFPQCKIQVGAYSTAIYEGLGFGLTTYIYDVGHADTMIELCRQGYATYVRNVEELYAHITADAMHDNKTGKEFWKMNSLENICDEINKLLK